MFSLKWILSLFSLLCILSCASAVVRADDLEMSDVRLNLYLNPAGSPFAFLKDNMKVMHGVDVDIIHEMQKRLGFELVDNRMYPLDVEHTILLNQKGEVDFYGGGLPYTKEYTDLFAPLPIYVKSSLGVLYSDKNHSDIKSTNDLKDLKVGIAPNASSRYFVNKFGAKPIEIQNLSYAFYLVDRGELDALIYDRIILKDFAKSTQNKAFKVLDEEFGNDRCQYTFYVSKISPYRRPLTQTLQNMLNDGTVNKILTKWGIEVKQPVKRRKPRS